MKINDPDQISAAPDGGRPETQPKWRQAFPIDWPRDEYRSRRDFTKLLGLTSFAFVVGQAWIVYLALKKRINPPPSGFEIASVDELPVGGAKLFHYPTAIDPCLLVRLAEDEFIAFGQKCTHLSCPVIPKVPEGIFYCPCHAGAFELRTGLPVMGPPRRPLTRVLVEVRDGKVRAMGVEHQSEV